MNQFWQIRCGNYLSEVTLIQDSQSEIAHSFKSCIRCEFALEPHLIGTLQVVVLSIERHVGRFTFLHKLKKVLVEVPRPCPGRFLIHLEIVEDIELVRKVGGPE